MKAGPYRQWATGPCFYCGRATFRCAGASKAPYKYTRDHIVPRVMLRDAVPITEHWRVTVTCCNACNLRKGTMSAREFIIKHVSKRRHNRIDWTVIDHAYRAYQEAASRSTGSSSTAAIK